MGEFDELCPLEDGEQLFDMLRCPKELWVYENETHTFGGRLPDFYLHVADWMRDALDGKLPAGHARRIDPPRAEPSSPASTTKTNDQEPPMTVPFDRLALPARRRALVAGLALGAALFSLATPAAAQGSYPNRPIRMVVPFPAGESIDVIARVVAERWSTLLGQQIVVDNRGGAGGMIGTDMVAKAPPDGYTILMGNVGGLAIIPATSKKTPYDLQKDFTPISQVSSVPFFLYVSAQTPFTTVQSVVDFGKANPGKLNFASTGIGWGVHLAGELFKTVAGIDMTHVPYKGVSQALPELINGNVQLVFYPLTFLPQVKDGKLRTLMITAPKRSAQAPDVPTWAGWACPGWWRRRGTPWWPQPARRPRSFASCRRR